MIELYKMDVLPTMISLALIFILFITGAYKRSITTTIYVVVVAVSMQVDNSEIATSLIIAGAFVALLRAVLLGGEDRLMRGR